MSSENLILIGMPGAGKSTVGVILAKRLGYHFIDTDLLIQAQEGCRLQDIIDRQGLERFRQIEEQVLLGLETQRTVIATGGSVIYSRPGIEAIKRCGRLVYLQVGLAELQSRISDMGERGLVMGAGQSFSDLYAERTPLYAEHADVFVDCTGLNTEQVAARIEKQVLVGQIDRWVDMMTEKKND
ncbi:shikimate kinase [Malonomonas rubra DSM 5091]|uniref:Shikimate kinase n=1 Tax=Malonomonas rubra DSM 5091 TaxID=1122189 RepID=A0A1M6IB97_MALRU|nr:shikimate kinase [Malonomonas rubra]SHJ31772.1 shikimate kinase [Malonomonas rubra DSM 5091]